MRQLVALLACSLVTTPFLSCRFAILRTPEATVAFNHPSAMVPVPNPAVHGFTAAKVASTYDKYELVSWSEHELCVRLTTGARPAGLRTSDFFTRTADSFEQLNTEDKTRLIAASGITVESSESRPVQWREEKPVYIRDGNGKVIAQTTTERTRFDTSTTTVARICFPDGGGVKPSSKYLGLHRMVGEPKKTDIALLELKP